MDVCQSGGGQFERLLRSDDILAGPLSLTVGLIELRIAFAGGRASHDHDLKSNAQPLVILSSRSLHRLLTKSILRCDVNFVSVSRPMRAEWGKVARLHKPACMQWRSFVYFLNLDLLG